MRARQSYARRGLPSGADHACSSSSSPPQGSKHDLVRTGRIVVWGGGLFAPAITQWFKVLQKVNLGNAVTTTAARVGLDQFLCAPVVVTGFFTFMTLTEGKDLATVKHKLRNVRPSLSLPACLPSPPELTLRLAAAAGLQELLPTLKANWGVFIPTQAINFSVVPPAYRLLTINLVNMCVPLPVACPSRPLPVPPAAADVARPSPRSPWNTYLSIQANKK